MESEDTVFSRLNGLKQASGDHPAVAEFRSGDLSESPLNRPLDNCRWT